MKELIRGFDTRSSMDVLMDTAVTKTDNLTYDLIFVLEGQLLIQLTEAHYILGVEDILIVNKNTAYEIKKMTEQNLFFRLSISDSLLSHAVHPEAITFNCNSVLNKDLSYDALRHHLRQLVQLFLLKEDKARFLEYSCLFSLLNELLTNFAAKTKRVEKSDGKEQEIIAYIYEHYYEKLSLETLASTFYMDTSYFSKYFKKLLGVNFKEYLTTIRLNFAQRDLLDSDKSVARIAVDNGFANVNSFNQAFKKAFQQTPSGYRQQEKQVSAAKEIEDYGEMIKRYQASEEACELHQQSFSNEYVIDASQTTAEIHPPWNELINIGDALGLLSDSMQRHIMALRNYTAFKHVRFWYLFSEQLFIDWDKGEITNFDRIDQLFDFLISNQMIPWIQLNKQKEINGHSELLKQDEEKWQQILSSFLYHILNRYGKKALRDWKFELVINNQMDETEQKQYVHFFQLTQAILKTIHPQLELGGAGFKIEQDVQQLGDVLHYFTKHGVTFDFYSFLLFPYIRTISGDQRNSQRIADENYMLTYVKRIREVLHSFAKRPLYITEWNNTVSNHNLINDTLYKGAYVLKNSIALVNQVEGMAYWVASDLYHASSEERAILNGGTGLISKHGFAKPALLAMKFLKELTDGQLIFHTETLIACEVDESEYLIIGHNYQHPNQLYYLKDERSIVPRGIKTFFQQEKKKIRICLTNLPKGTYEVRFYFCDREHGDIFQRWKELDFLHEMRPSDIRYLKERNSVGMRINEVTVKSNHLDLDYLLEENMFFSINIFKKTKIM